MILRPTRIELVRAVLALCGLLLSVVLGWYLLSGADLALLFKSWGVPRGSLASPGSASWVWLCLA